MGDEVAVYSAGTKAKGIDPLAAEVMSEVGISVGEQGSKTVEDLVSKDPSLSFDLVITVCPNAQENCPGMFIEWLNLEK